ncbi:MAG: PAS domain S-box protein [Caldithrix sp.]|nr:PAS domain S-box protein [Caldithrix sp.]
MFSSDHQSKIRFNLFNLLILIFLVPTVINAQQLNIKNYGIRDGLVQSQVMDIIQDEDRYLWLATLGGISKFDGTTFKNYTVNDGLANNVIHCLARDNNGNLWFGHEHGLLTKYNWQDKSFENIALDSLTAGIGPVIIKKILVSGDNSLWLATLKSGLLHFTTDTVVSYTQNNGLLHDEVYDLIQTADEHLWYTTPNGVGILNPHTNQHDSLTKADGLPQNFILSIALDNNQRIWLGTGSKGVMCYDPQSGQEDSKWIRYTEQDGLISQLIWDLHVDAFNNIWVAHYGDGVSKIEAPSKNEGNKRSIFTFNEKQGLANNNITKIYGDVENNIWFGCDGGGLSKFSGNIFELYGKNEGLVDDPVWSIISDPKGRYWLGTENAITQINPVRDNQANAIKNYRKAGDLNLFYNYQSLIDSSNRIWFLSLYRGPVIYNESKDTFELFELPDSLSPEVSSMTVDGDGKLWFTTFNDGLVVYYPRRNKFERFTRETSRLPHDSLRYIFSDSRNHLWISADNGSLIHYNGHTFMDHTIDDSIHSHTIKSMTEDQLGNIWLVSDQDHLYRYDGTVFEDFTRLSPFRNETLYSVIADNTILWVGTSKGVVRFNVTDSSYIWNSNIRGYPLIEPNDDAIHKDREGYIWFGTIYGAIKYKPENELPHANPPATHITDIQVLHESISLNQKQRFSYNENYFKFEFTGINLRAPDGIKFKYLLHGSNTKDWSREMEGNAITFSELPPGNYEFLVKSGNEHGIWDPQPARFAFHIAEPFWMHWWVQLIVLLSVVGIVVMYIRQRFVNINKTRKLLEYKVQQRTKELETEKGNAVQAHNALKESEAKFRLFTETTTSAIFIIQGTKFKYLNPASTVITGYPEKEMKQLNFWDLISAEHRYVVKQRGLQRQAGMNVPNRYNFKILRKDGEERWVDFTAKRIEYEGLAAILGTIVDINDQVEAKSALRREKERLSVTLSSIGDGVVTADLDQKIILFNDAAEEISGWTAEEAEGRALTDIFRIHSQSLNSLSFIQCTSDNNKDKVGWLTGKDGSKKLVEFNCAKISNQTNVLGYVLAFRDITEKEQLKEELLKSQKLESIGVLAGGIAHDFNNILMAITGNLSLLRRHNEENEKAIRMIDIAENACNRAQDLTQRLLTFAKGGSPVKTRIPVKELIIEAAELIIRGTAVQYKLHMDEDELFINADSGQITQVLHNLMINAVQSMPEGGLIDIHVQPMEIEKAQNLPLNEGSYIRISISDSGIGIPNKFLHKVFDPFFTTKDRGNGLGLATVYSIINKHGGHISVESTVGKGTTFFIDLPLSNGKKNKPATPAELPDTFLESGRVLIMDDDVSVQETAAEMFGNFGFEVVCCKDGNEAVELYREAMSEKRPFDLVILDLTIPGGPGGVATVRQLAELDEKVIAYLTSGYSNDHTMSEYHKYGFKGCLKKPFRLEDVQNILGNYLKISEYESANKQR